MLGTQNRLMPSNTFIELLPPVDRKSTRLNSSHVSISYAVFCLKKKRARGLAGAVGQAGEAAADDAAADRRARSVPLSEAGAVVLVEADAVLCVLQALDVVAVSD